MMQPQLHKIAIQGFRSFGQIRQVIDPAPSISALWGGNSQGKITFAEALELLASAKDEFAEALRNAYIDPKFPVLVEAHIRCSDGQIRRLTRTLVEDYREELRRGLSAAWKLTASPVPRGRLRQRSG
jgi:hypothetical protein